MPAEQAALARGFVLGEDDRIPADVTDAFQRSGLAHHLAVSGENIVLLAVLAAPLLAALGIPLRARLLWLLVLIAIYVPLAGGGASIQRAGVMGAAAIVATLAGRPASRIYALLLAVAATLALNPRASSDVGWQLSFAAVAGIFVLGAPLRDVLLARLRGRDGWRRALADGLAVTIAATLATAPLMAHHFEALSVTSLLANLLALPAVAPAMWLGMIVAALGQLPAIPVEPLNWLNSLLLAYIGQIARWMGGPRWARVGLPLSSWTSVGATYAALLAAALPLRRWAAGRAGMLARPGLRPGGVPRLGVALLAALAVVFAAGLRGHGTAAPVIGLRVSVLDVGQGDSILLQPANGAPLLVDGGPPGDDLRAKLADLGVSSLAAAVVTHDQSDHAGGVEELLGSFPVGRLVYAELGSRLIERARAAGAVPTRVAEGGELRSGSLRLEVLWPPRELLAGPPPEDPNTECIVLLARWRHFEMLLTADAEAEAVPIDPGPIDVLKVAHHGSADSGLGGLLDRTAPELAVISVGAHNPYGHPEPGTLATLAGHQVPVLRTDFDGTVSIDVSRAQVHVEHP
jgi:competence protein ComEC